MRLTILALADYGSVDVTTQKMNILGIFTQMLSRQYPFKHHRFVIIAKIVADLGDSSEPHNLVMTMADADAKTVIARLETKITIPFDQQGRRPDFNLILELNTLEFPHPGDYQVLISVDDIELGATSIELIKVD
jgi:hypothetical protein